MPKKLSKAGKNISAPAEVQNISSHGIWILVEGHEFFMPFVSFPWFRKATVEQISNFEFLHGHHLHWPDLDVDIDVDALRNPEKYPLKAIVEKVPEIKTKLTSLKPKAKSVKLDGDEANKRR